MCAFRFKDDLLTICLWWAPQKAGGAYWWAEALTLTGEGKDHAIGEVFPTATRALDSALAALLAELDKPGKAIRARFPRETGPKARKPR